ncbi:hypothetical protein [Kineosporia succinea]|uniref:Uncharacterized protein n=1 Tax=Kineosporia succinea TaxID=84632 RepID=A0ABT9P6Z8_9ACTN|nr:hypothetical protein [Kineosporia succinea]MDP9828463.1 hypothetical protein [Kineosporia succinea]
MAVALTSVLLATAGTVAGAQSAQAVAEVNVRLCNSNPQVTFHVNDLTRGFAVYSGRADTCVATKLYAGDVFSVQVHALLNPALVRQASGGGNVISGSCGSNTHVLLVRGTTYTDATYIYAC